MSTGCTYPSEDETPVDLACRPIPSDVSGKAQMKAVNEVAKESAKLLSSKQARQWDP
ncbi:MAG: hypothetical protein OEV74_20950 [Cyclobacteriaceae bacterium]|jgi:hypothetical protein|nr:hypothetical protein [Cyclobacteriaceae bacterium]MDH4298753.1 hypothetical protein [Cyclobacteriaceae bacterium]MDH5249513.1 hypothetical protein [Cyclobacteriaceae bacterium]